MEYTQLIASRFSVRNFADKKVAKEDLEKILNAGLAAPTGCNYQPQRVFVIESDEALSKLKDCTKCHFNAPLALIVCYNKDEVWRRKYDGKNSGVADASIVTTHMMLEAHNIGVGATWVMHFNPEKVVAEFEIPENIVPVAILTLGYPSENAKPLEMHYESKTLDETVIYK